jgi:hypothetical protein
VPGWITNQPESETNMQPHPQAAAALQQLSIPADRKAWSALRDYMVEYGQNGIPGNAVLEHINVLVHLLAAAQLDNMQAIMGVNAGQRGGWQ